MLFVCAGNPLKNTDTLAELFEVLLGGIHLHARVEHVDVVGEIALVCVELLFERSKPVLERVDVATRLSLSGLQFVNTAPDIDVVDQPAQRFARAARCPRGRGCRCRTQSSRPAALLRALVRWTAPLVTRTTRLWP